MCEIFKAANIGADNMPIESLSYSETGVECALH